MDCSRVGEPQRRHFQPLFNPTPGSMVRGRDRRGSSHPGTDSLRPRREVASGANLGQQPCLPSRLEKSQPERPVLLLLRSNSCQQKAEYSRSRLHPEIAKLLSQETEWTSNAVGDHHPPPPGETENLKKVAEQFGFPQGGGADPPPLETAPKQDVPATSSSKKKKGKRKVKDMLEKARWRVQGTPLDPHYKRPIRLSTKKKKKKNSSSESTSRSASLSSETSSLESEHRLRKIDQKLPGYLAFKAPKEAATNGE